MRLTRRMLPVTAAAVLTVALAGCGEESSSEEGKAASSASSSAFPVTIDTAFGEVTIESKPERIATVAWMNHEVPLALGVMPVGMAAASYGDDDGDGILPWVEPTVEELEADGAEAPVLFDETEGIDFEAVADTQPDVILASYSGLTQDDFDTLSKIAPVVAYPENAWGTSVDDMITMNATAMGMADEGEALVEQLDTEVDDSFSAHDVLLGKKVMFAYIDPNDLSTIGFYTSLDTRPAFLTAHGMETPDVVAAESEGTDEFYTTVSAERADELSDVDLIVTYGDADGALLAAMQDDALLSQIPAVAEGRVAVLEDGTPLAAAANPTPLSISWGIDDYLDALAAPLEG
ncbi:iron-siderophore ABC transporter substrate-binding protein [Nocardioides bruguierae]|uniref:iron-siderophore ABC transporter substrate-binding protein n=1 Tax=Nocardioides bruguierae TaxID=2945102 RepID=UPI0020228159|nr:iron-siderophore ABC transporter substrate-binding protein [Nocardioides bruguierae]MCL8025338.1 iron-siderophore ABC transporter substrate-binding protein [Nocardioides bruguierae]